MSLQYQSLFDVSNRCDSLLNVDTSHHLTCPIYTNHYSMSYRCEFLCDAIHYTTCHMALNHYLTSYRHESLFDVSYRCESLFEVSNRTDSI